MLCSAVSPPFVVETPTVTCLLQIELASVVSPPFAVETQPFVRSFCVWQHLHLWLVIKVTYIASLIQSNCSFCVHKQTTNKQTHNQWQSWLNSN